MDNNSQLNRMKALMNYGLKTESKNAPYSSVEYQKVGADGNIYGIVREGTKFYIKSAPNKDNVLKEDFNYIGGFRNRKNHEYDSFASAQKNFELKMMSINEACNNKNFSVSTWDLDKKENVVVEATEKMRKEILRERQIMKNATLINEKKCEGIGCEIADTQKDNIKAEKPETGDAKDANDEYKEAKLPKEMNEGEVLGWNDNKDYMDTSHGTEIGSSAPFDAAKGKQITDDGESNPNTGDMNNGVVEEGESMHDKDNQNTPTPGVGEGPSDEHNKPFDAEKGKQIDEALDIDDTVEDGEGDVEDIDITDDEVGDEGDFGGEDLGDEDLGDEGLGDEELGDEEDFDAEVGDEEGAEDVVDNDIENRLSSLEDLINQIAEKLGVAPEQVSDEPYEDEELYDVEIGDDGDGEEIEDDVIEDCDVFESVNFKRAMKRMVNEEGMKPFKDGGRVPSGNMNKLDVFGKHPAYQKKVMELPPKDMTEFPDYYDMNDDSVKNDTPYGEKIGDGAPFEISPESIDNAIAEAFKRLKKNI